MPYPFGSVQRSIMNHLADALASPSSEVFDLRAVAPIVKATTGNLLSRERCID
jgi:hypothetical protein